MATTEFLSDTATPSFWPRVRGRSLTSHRAHSSSRRWLNAEARLPKRAHSILHAKRFSHSCEHCVSAIVVLAPGQGGNGGGVESLRSLRRTAPTYQECLCFPERGMSRARPFRASEWNRLHTPADREREGVACSRHVSTTRSPDRRRQPFLDPPRSVDLERELALNVVTVAVDELVVDGGNAQPLDLAALVSHAVMR